MKKNSILFLVFLVLGGLFQSCSSDDNKDLEFGIRQLPSIGGTSSTLGLRKAVGATWLGWSYALESDGEVVVNVPKDLNSLFDYRMTSSDNTAAVLMDVANNNKSIGIVVEDESIGLEEDQLSKKVIGYTEEGDKVYVVIGVKAPNTTEAYKIYEFLTTPAGQSIVATCGYRPL